MRVVWRVLFGLFLLVDLWAGLLSARRPWIRSLPGVRLHPLPPAHTVARSENTANGLLPFSSLWLPVNKGYFELHPRKSASLRAAQIALAVRRFQAAQGRMPTALEELVPEYLDTVPVDPFDGQPLRYVRRDGSGFAVYSVGPDGRDNGGDERPKRRPGEPFNLVFY